MADQEDFGYMPVTIKVESGTKIKACQIVTMKDGKVYPAKKTGDPN